MRMWHLAAMMLAIAISAKPACASTVFEQFNGPPGPGTGGSTFIWIPDDIGWYWTPGSDVELEGIQTQLGTASNINNNLTFTTTLYDERPDAGGVSLGSFNWNGTSFVDGPWLGGTFGSPISLTGGNQYFVGMSGWGAGNAGINWVPSPLGSPVENLGAGSSYLSSSGNPGSFDIQLSSAGLGTTDQGVLRFLEADPVQPPTGGPVPEPASVAMFAIGALGFGVIGLRRRKREQVAE